MQVVFEEGGEKYKEDQGVDLYWQIEKPVRHPDHAYGAESDEDVSENKQLAIKSEFLLIDFIIFWQLVLFQMVDKKFAIVPMKVILFR